MIAQYLCAIVGSNVVAVAVINGIVGMFFWRTAARLDRRIDNDKSAANADRRAFKAAMDDFRTEMRRLAGGQSRIEGTKRE